MRIVTALMVAIVLLSQPATLHAYKHIDQAGDFEACLLCQLAGGAALIDLTSLALFIPELRDSGALISAYAYPCLDGQFCCVSSIRGPPAIP